MTRAREMRCFTSCNKYRNGIQPVSEAEGIDEFSKDRFISEEEIGGRGERSWKGWRKRQKKMLCLIFLAS
jgi:hypothetical protein